MLKISDSVTIKSEGPPDYEQLEEVFDTIRRGIQENAWRGEKYQVVVSFEVQKIN